MHLDVVDEVERVVEFTPPDAPSWIGNFQRGMTNLDAVTGRDDKLDGFVTRMGRGSATEDDRAALAAFLAGDDAVVRHEVGALRDAWYGWD